MVGRHGASALVFFNERPGDSLHPGKNVGNWFIGPGPKTRGRTTVGAPKPRHVLINTAAPHADRNHYRRGVFVTPSVYGDGGRDSIADLLVNQPTTAAWKTELGRGGHGADNLEIPVSFTCVSTIGAAKLCLKSEGSGEGKKKSGAGGKKKGKNKKKGKKGRNGGNEARTPEVPTTPPSTEDGAHGRWARSQVGV